ncbi:MAG: HAMP domain-containing histidine kinase [Sandaracinaceae bacterium]|nr:HAMP domain-containing histidine kinase [Sandaracinaceae bacterium]
MSRWRLRILYFVLLPAIAAASVILGYYTWVTASQYEALGEQSIAQSTLLLVQEKVDRVEQRIIDADNSVFHLIDPEHPEEIERSWPPLAERISPSVRAVLVLDDGGNTIAYAARATPEEKRNFLKLFTDHILPDLELETQYVGRLKHLQHSYGTTNYLVSYKALMHEGRRYYVVAHHDTGYIMREEFPVLFVNEEGKRLYNVVDEDGHRVYGESLARSGDYLVGRRFPTTLYQWRLQVAPKQAPLLDQNNRTRRINEVTLIALSFGIILIGSLFLVYAADKERRLNELKGEFIANVSHELKTPLSVVRMFGEMLLTNRVKSPEKQQEYLEIICRESERLSALIENVLDFAAIERGKAKYEMHERDLGDVVARAIDTFRYRIEKDGVEVRLTREGGMLVIPIDEQAILLATINLLDNAVKYGGGTGVDVKVSNVGQELVVQVRDHGPGIPAEDLSKVFERFYRSRRDVNARGSGIGLSLVEQIVTAHGGRAWAENADGGGATVAFALPLFPNPKAALNRISPRAV